MNTASLLCVLSIMHTQTHTEVWNPLTLFDVFTSKQQPKKSNEAKALLMNGCYIILDNSLFFWK